MCGAAAFFRDGLVTELGGREISHGGTVIVHESPTIYPYEVAGTFRGEVVTMLGAEVISREAAMIVALARSAIQLLYVPLPCSSCIPCHEEGRGIAGNAMARPPFFAACRGWPPEVSMSLFWAATPASPSWTPGRQCEGSVRVELLPRESPRSSLVVPFQGPFVPYFARPS